ncbi:butyrate kinase [Symbiobacterium terraclitae]|uniref:butyrate kinase n=1 Tax=Symbiobacterium terraclitae TaxID=557451 RepID=UPI0035B50169
MTTVSADAPRILVINPTATATHVALFDGEEERLAAELVHSREELARFERIWDQFLMRRDRITGYLRDAGVPLESLRAVVGRGGLMKPVPGGVYAVNGAMLEDLRAGVQGEHASNLGGILAYGIAHALGIPAFVVDPVSTDEMRAEAHLTGLPELRRSSLAHALNMRWIARKAAAALGKAYAEANLVVAHLGAGISVSAHQGGRMVDATNALEDGPFAPERAGRLPAGDLVRLCFSGRYTERQLIRKLTAEGGLIAHLGTADWREVERRIEQGDQQADLVYSAMAYQVAREIGAMAVALRARADAVVLTGELAHSDRLTGMISARVGWIAPVMRFPGSEENRALAAGALRVLRGEEEALTYR